MSLELLNTVFAGATFIVIAITAVSASIQLRHLRASNQLMALTTVLNDWQRPELQAWMRFVRFELPEKLKDPAYVQSLKGALLDRTKHPGLLLADYFEVVGCLIKYRLLDKTAYVDSMCGPIVGSYRAILPLLQILRAQVGDSAIYENFEYLATECQLWIKRHPGGSYPKRFPHFADEQSV